MRRIYPGFFAPNGLLDPHIRHFALNGRGQIRTRAEIESGVGPWHAASGSTHPDSKR